MARRHTVPARLGVACAIALVALSSSPAPAAPNALERARERIERTSAELAQARTAARGLGGEALAEVRRLERRLQAEKEALLRAESRLEAQTAPAGGPDAASGAAPAPAPDGDGPVVRLADVPEEPSAGAGGAPPRGAGGALAAHIDGYLASKASPLTGLGAVFVAESRAAGIDPRFLVAIAGAETSFATYGPSHAIRNPFGMGPGIAYGSWEEAIGAAARNLGGHLYLGDGRVTIAAIQERWAPNGAANDPTGLNSHWTRNVGTYYAELGGNPAAPVAVAPDAGAPAAPDAPADPDAAPPVPARRATMPGLPYRVPAAPVVVGAVDAGPAAAERALSALGRPSVPGGTGPRRFDAAGLARWAYAREGVALPRRLAEQARGGEAVAPAALRAGDLVLFSDGAGGVAHAGLYLGGGQLVHAPPGGGAVAIASLYDPVLAAAYAGARRY